jgi:hypothetical protein
MSATPLAPYDTPPLCANCGTPLSGAHCITCGQHRRDSQRLELRLVVRRFLETVYDFDSAFLRTWKGLTRRPGLVCREYIEGRRKTYMNPFGYLLLASTVSVLLEGLLPRLMPAPGIQADEEEGSFYQLLMLALLVPYAWLWSKLFRRQSFNLAEHYVFALYIAGHFIWFEILVLLPLSPFLTEPVNWGLFAALLTVYVTAAATTFYREPVGIVIGKLLLSNLVVAIVVTILAAIAGWLGLISLET